MDGPIDTAPARPPVTGPSRCLGCLSRVMSTSPHDCGGNRITAQGMGWSCDCPRHDCRQRQQGNWSTGKRRARK